MAERLDVAIVGAGPAGIAAAVRAARQGLSHVLIERGALADTIDHYQKGKWVMAEPAKLRMHDDIEVDFEASSREQVLANFKRAIDESGVHLVEGSAYEITEIRGEKGDFVLETKDGTQFAAQHVLLSIGTRGNRRRFGVPGEQLSHVVYDLADPAAYEHRRVVVVGVGDAGIENALALTEYASQVSIINRRQDFDRAKPRNRALIREAITNGLITHYSGAVVTGFEERAVLLNTEQGERRLEADRVIGQLGALPPRGFLEHLGIEFESGGSETLPRVSDKLESSVPGIYLAGGLVGRTLIKGCMNGGYEVIEHICGRTVRSPDEPLLEGILAALGETVDDVVDSIRERIPIFESLSPIQLREFLIDSQVHYDDSSVRRVKAGRTIIRRGDHSDTFYSILEGSVNVQVPNSRADADTQLRKNECSVREIILGPGEFFGEDTLISGRRRTASVKAESDVVLIETSRMAMNKLLASHERVSRIIDAVNLDRRLQNLAPSLSEAEREVLADSAEVMKFSGGSILFEEGQAPDGLHLIRRGTVEISKQKDGREIIVKYLRSGSYLGELSLLHPSGARSATARAMARTETLRIPEQQIREVTQRHSHLLDEFIERSEEVIRRDQLIMHDDESADLLQFLSGSGVGEATDLLYIDESLCIRCDNCETACARTHGGIARLDREAGPRFGNSHLPTACQHCENPKCMTDCPPDAIHRHPNGEVFIDDSCIGCGNCAASCPYNVIKMAEAPGPPVRGILGRLLFGRKSPGLEPAKEVAVKCDLCRKLPKPRSGRAAAACVAACPTGAILRVEPGEFIREIRRRGSR